MLDPTSFQIEVQASEEWINDYVASKSPIIEIREGYTIGNINLSIRATEIKITADLISKPGSSLEVAAKIFWNAETQTFSVENLDIETHSKNLLLKGAGWFADTFLQSKMDAVIEKKVNELIASEMTKAKEGNLRIPVKQMGFAEIDADEIKIEKLIFNDGFVTLSVSFSGGVKIHLQREEVEA